MVSKNSQFLIYVTLNCAFIFLIYFLLLDNSQGLLLALWSVIILSRVHETICGTGNWTEIVYTTSSLPSVLSAPTSWPVTCMGRNIVQKFRLPVFRSQLCLFVTEWFRHITWSFCDQVLGFLFSDCGFLKALTTELLWVLSG